MSIDKEKIEALLPQTQCEQCGFQGCSPYADALLQGEAINRCVPGGQVTADALADLLKQPRQALASDDLLKSQQDKAIAVIDESKCIGCTFCLTACPVDAIFGAAKQMHHVVTKDCTGCELCLPSCPMSCITMAALNPPQPTWLIAQPRQRQEQAHTARARRVIKIERLAKDKAVKMRKQPSNPKPIPKNFDIQAALAAALDRGQTARQQKQQRFQDE